MNEAYDVSSHIKTITSTTNRKAYATVLHSSEDYACDALTLAQSLVKMGTKHDLILLLDTSISAPKGKALARAGWKLRFIKRTRNPRAKMNTYNEYNYSKLRLWQLTDYDQIIFVTSIFSSVCPTYRLRQVNFQFRTNGDRAIKLHIRYVHATYKRNYIVQGFLNEVFVWWHRLPRRVNFLKDFWSTSSNGTHWYVADPPKFYAIHYLGLKSWMCYRDYDCNWDVLEKHAFANDDAHRS
ncbi:hypothetical protein P3L10_032240 [Capsicum annuum]